MKAMIAALVGLLAFALPTASAQTWTFAGVNFEPRTGWCTSNVLDNGSPALKAQPCGVDYPYMTIGQVLPPSEGADVDLPAAAVKSADQAAGDEGKKLVAELVAKSYANCTRGTHSVERDPVDQVFGFTTFSVFNCPTAPGGTVTFRNFSGYAKTTGGAIWVVAFDYPLADLSVDDKAMLRSAVKAISASK